MANSLGMAWHGIKVDGYVRLDGVIALHCIVSHMVLAAMTPID